MSCSTHGAETSCLVRLFGPMQDCSFWVAFAEMVMIAFKKSPAEVCMEDECSDEM